MAKIDSKASETTTEALPKIFLAMERWAFSPVVLADPEQSRQARRLFLTITLAGLSLVPIIFSAIFIDPEARHRYITIISGHFIMLSSPLWFRRSKTIDKAAMALATTVPLQLLSTSVLSGGSDSLALYIFPLVPFAITFLCGMKPAVISTCILALVTICVWSLQSLGLLEIDRVRSSLVGLFVMLWSIATGIGLAWLYVSQNTKILKQLRDEVKERQLAQESLEQSQVELSKANRAKDDFLAYMAHEIRNPLMAIQGSTELLQLSTDAQGDSPDYVHAVQEGVQSIRALLSQVLDYAKSEKSTLILKKIRLLDCVESVASQFRGQIASNGLDFSLEVNGLDEVYVNASRPHLIQVIANLLGNAINFTQEGSISMRVMIPGEVRCRIEIEDSGTGIAPEDQESIFRPYRQASSLDRRGRGTGLGLTIALHLIKQMHGTIEVYSELGKGSCFSIEIPTCSARIRKHSAVEKTDLNDALLNKRIALVDDDPSVLAALTALLHSLGAETYTFSNGQEAVDKLIEIKPDFILLDLYMPQQSGLETVALIHDKFSKSDSDMSMPVILAVTADIEYETEDLLAAGFANRIVKPVTRTQLHDALVNA